MRSNYSTIQAPIPFRFLKKPYCSSTSYIFLCKSSLFTRIYKTWTSIKYTDSIVFKSNVSQVYHFYTKEKGADRYRYPVALHRY